MANIRQIVRKLAGTEAAEIAEVAVVLPLVFTLLLGIVWFGRAFNIYSTITQAAQQGAITAAREACATCGAPGLPSAGTVDTAVTAVLKASSLDVTQITQWEANNPTPGLLACPAPAPAPACSVTANKVWVCSSVLLNSSTQPTPQCGAMVSFQFPFKFYLPFTSLNMQQITMSAQGQSRMEN
jgi:Flp pilus assembly protein TadG